MSASIPQFSSAYSAFREGIAVAPAEAAGWLRAIGADRVRWLNGMVTNSVQALKAGEGAYTFVLNAQGRIQGDGIVWMDDDSVLIETSANQAETLRELLDRFIIMDEVELEDVSASLHGVRIAGAKSAELLEGLGIAVPEAANSWAVSNWMEHRVRVQTIAVASVPMIEIWANEAQVSQELLNTMVSRGASQVSSADFEVLRISQGIPRFGVDIRERDLPQETGQMRALHFNKGCYLGQEIVERIRSRGAVHRGLQMFRLSAAPAELPAALTAEEKVIGEITSAAHTPDGVVGMGIVRREAVERGATITFEGGVATATHAL